MAKIFHTKKVVPISEMNLPSPTITRDGNSRITKLEYSYTSIKVTYDATWTGNELATYTQTIVDL